MNLTTALKRKLIYLVILIAMLVPLYVLGQPSAGNGDSGQLTAMREKYNIAESDLGEISPASETMKLASLGLRGVAATLLWQKAHDFQISHEWDRLKAALNQIALLQPHYDRVWEHQSHNLSYNVSIQFDDYRQRYAMVREGAEFLTRGVRQNRRAPRLVWYLGWFYGQKIGKADERVQYRRLFAEDTILHQKLLDEGIDYTIADGPAGPDNWLVGQLWLNHGYDLVDKGGVKLRRVSPINFYEQGPKSSLHFAEAIEREGYLYDGEGEKAWSKAHRDWVDFGERSIDGGDRFTVKLGELDDLKNSREEAIESFRSLAGEAYQDAMREKMDQMPQDIKDTFNKAPSERTEAGRDAIAAIERELLPEFGKIAKAADPAVRLRAVNLVSEINDYAGRIRGTQGLREQINYEYWLTLSQAEQESRTVLARQKIYEAEKANSDALLDEAIKLYREAFVIWADIFDTYPVLTIDDSAEDLYESIRRYMVAIDSEDLPEDFPLHTFAKLMREGGSVNPQLYEEYRKTQKEKAKARAKELEAEMAELEAAENKEKEEKKEADEAKPEPKTDSDTDASKAPETDGNDAANAEKKEMKEESGSEDSKSPESEPNAGADESKSDSDEDKSDDGKERAEAKDKETEPV